MTFVLGDWRLETGDWRLEIVDFSHTSGNGDLHACGGLVGGKSFSSLLFLFLFLFLGLFLFPVSVSTISSSGNR